MSTDQKQRRAAQRPLSSEEVSAIIREAGKREGKEHQANLEGALTVDDAYELARQLGIPEEHVTAAARDLEAGRIRGKHSAKVQKARRNQALIAGLVVLVIGGIWLGKLAGGLLFTFFLLLLTLIFVVLLGRWLFTAIGDGDLKSEPPPVAGTCRVCFKPAHSPESTFCEEHRYKLPSEKG